MVRHARLEWRCRRGIRELDLLLLTWLDERFDLTPALEQRVFLELLDLPDDELARLLLGRAASPIPAVNALAEKIRALPLSRP